MILYVSAMGSDRTELLDALEREGVNYRESAAGTKRELGTAEAGTVAVEANLPEVSPVPKEYTQGGVDVRAWRLPSGKLIIGDIHGNLEQIAPPPPQYRG